MKKVNLPTIIMLGFSLIELTITIAIIGILSYTFLSLYSEYSTKAQIDAALNLLQAHRKKAEAFYLDHNTVNNNGFQTLNDIAQLDGSSGSSDASARLSSITLVNNTTSINLTATFNSQAAAEIRGKNLNLTIAINNETGVFFSSCSSTDIDNALLPQECRT